MKSKTRVCPLYFADNCKKYLSNPEDIAEFFTAVKKSEGWLNGKKSPVIKDEEKGCLKGTIGFLSDWEMIADDLNKMKIPSLELYEFHF